MLPHAIAVLTGDLVGSTRHSTSVTDDAMRVISDASTSIAGWSSQPDARFTRFRGDGWQIYLDDPELCLRAALVIVASLRARAIGTSTRVSIAIGAAETLGTRDLSDAAGPVFQLSGRELDSMPRLGRIALSGQSVVYQDAIIARLVFERTSRWTQMQAEAMALYLHPDNPTLLDIAPALAITPQAVNYRLGGGGATHLRQNLQLWEDEKLQELRVTP